MPDFDQNLASGPSPEPPYLDLSISKHATLAKLASLDKLTDQLCVRLSAEQSEQAIETAIRFFKEAYPSDNIKDCYKKESHQILLRREFVLALVEVLETDIDATTERFAPIDNKLEMNPGFRFLKKAPQIEQQLCAVDPLRWIYGDLVGSAAKEPTKQELALIRLWRINDIMVGTEKEIGGPQEMRQCILKLCKAKREK